MSQRTHSQDGVQYTVSTVKTPAGVQISLQVEKVDTVYISNVRLTGLVGKDKYANNKEG